MEIHLSGASRPVPLLSSCLPCCPHPLLARLLCQHLLAAITSISASPLFRLLQLGRSNKQHAAAARLHLPSPLHFPVQSLPTLPEASPTFPSGAHIALRSLMRSIYQTGKHRCPFPKQQEGKSLGTALVAESDTEPERLQRQPRSFPAIGGTACACTWTMASSAPAQT